MKITQDFSHITLVREDNIKTMAENQITNNDIFNLLKESTAAMNANMEELKNEVRINYVKIENLKEVVEKSYKKN